MGTSKSVAIQSEGQVIPGSGNWHLKSGWFCETESLTSGACTLRVSSRFELKLLDTQCQRTGELQGGVRSGIRKKDITDANVI